MTLQGCLLAIVGFVQTCVLKCPCNSCRAWTPIVEHRERSQMAGRRRATATYSTMQGLSWQGACRLFKTSENLCCVLLCLTSVLRTLVLSLFWWKGPSFCCQIRTVVRIRGYPCAAHCAVKPNAIVLKQRVFSAAARFTGDGSVPHDKLLTSSSCIRAAACWSEWLQCLDCATTRPRSSTDPSMKMELRCFEG